jgi:hypothetical protein
MANIRIHVKVVAKNKVRVTGQPKPQKDGKPIKREAFKKDQDSLTFTSNKKDTVIKFVGSSPVAEMRPGSLIAIRPARGPFKVVRPVGPHHFDCGYIEDGKFKPYSYAGGSDIPPLC